VLPEIDFEGLARANRVGYREMRNDGDIQRVVADALAAAADGQPVLVNVHIDYSKRTRFTAGVIRTNLKRFALPDQARLIGRALWRRVTG
jgi:acetolactate synthase-1/2/3 large subunit